MAYSRRASNERDRIAGSTTQRRPPSRSRADVARGTVRASGADWAAAARARRRCSRSSRASLSAPGATMRSTHEAMADSRAARRFRAELARRRGQGERQHHASSRLPGTTSAFTERQYLRPRQRLYRQAQRRYRRPRQGGAAAGADHRAGARSSDRAGRGHAQPDRGDVAPERRRMPILPTSPGSATSRWSTRAG